MRHPRLSSDAKILLLYVQGLPEQNADKALSEHAKKIGITGRAYQRAKGLLVMFGFVHEWKRQNDRGFWVTDQLFANVPLTTEQAAAVRDERVGRASPAPAARTTDPGTQSPTVGPPGDRVVGDYKPADEEPGENYPHPPPEDGADDASDADDEGGRRDGTDGSDPSTSSPEFAEGEAVLLSLRHAHPQLHLGVREARGLAEAAAEWIRRGVSGADLRRVLTRELPRDGVRSAVGFLRHRLIQKLPAPPVPPPPPVAPPPVRELVVCAGSDEDDEHMFRPLFDEAMCGPCTRAANAAYAARRREEARNEPPPLSWRERVEAENGRAPDAGADCPEYGPPRAGKEASTAHPSLV
ncbi:hypothetical protein ACFU6R_01025 [Streptomyces sp. NPDC057499]|uniref:hypothetical protein n=1 Tax=Streptomyces sp. NPDC057499 TaxID=3346150 RepID=UPI0036C3EF27